ncbi:MAG: response regulator transcription factor [Nitrospinota bacterium]|nr:response regulator transcription factor [Nitrospinota bacterium]
MSTKPGQLHINAAIENRPDLVILDIMMPGVDGLEVFRKLRAEFQDLMILFLTARTLEEDMLKGFETGADDYLSKPVNLAELLARVKALVRRSKNWPRQFVHRFADITCDSTKRRVTRAGNNVSLSPMEFSLLWFFLEHNGETLNRDRLLVEIWGYEAGSITRTVDIHVARLRNKLEPDPSRSAFSGGAERPFRYSLTFGEIRFIPLDSLRWMNLIPRGWGPGIITPQPLPFPPPCFYPAPGFPGSGKRCPNERLRKARHRSDWRQPPDRGGL